MESVINKEYSKSESNADINQNRANNIAMNLLNLKNTKKDNNQRFNSNLTRNDFEFVFIIGKGGFGKVWRVKYKKTNELYALKEMSKTKIIDKKSENSINGEREFLSFLHHPFIVNMHFAFQDNDNLYLVMDLLTGGDLRYHCSRYRSFSEEQTRFFLACIIHSLSYIHKNNVIHRDIKPENLVLDDKGYVCITDFGVAKKNMKDNSSETSGTPGYMCPEVMNGKNHSFPADYFSIGVIGYEFMMGKRPYRGRGRKEIKEQMMNYQARITEEEMKDGWSIECVEFINALLERKEKRRLGYKEGVKELKQHPWMKYYPWKDLAKKNLPAPFIPENMDNFDKKYCESVDEISDETQLRYDEIILCTHYNTAFSDFYFDKNEAQRKEYEYEETEDNESQSEIDEEKKKNNIKKESDNIIKKREKILAIDNSEKDNKKEADTKNEIAQELIKNDYSKSGSHTKKINDIFEFPDKEKKNQHIINKLLDKEANKLNILMIKKGNDINKKRYILPKNNSYISLMQNSKRDKLNLISRNDIKKSNDDFINIKKICINSKNAISKITNQNSNLDIKDKYALLRKKQNKIMKLNNMIKINEHIKNSYNVNNHDINNNSNINIYLSINLFNKMINNHFNINKKKNINERNTIQDLLNKQKQLIMNDNKKKSVDNYIKYANQNSYFNKRKNIKQNNKINRSNSVGLLLNNNLNYGSNKIKQYSLNSLVINNHK